MSSDYPRVPGTVWKCEHCGGLRNDERACKFCGALEQPRSPPDRLREPLGIPTGRGYGMTVIGGAFAERSMRFEVTCTKTMCAERALLVMSGGPFWIDGLTINNKPQVGLRDPLHTDVVQQVGFVELPGDCLTPGSVVSMSARAIRPVWDGCELFLYLRGPCVETLPPRLPGWDPLGLGRRVR